MSSKLAQVSAEATAAEEASAPVRRLEWMYDPGVGVTKTDLELMNEAVDTSGGQNDDVKKMQAGEVSGSIFLNDITHPNSDTMRRLNEDPLFQIKKKEMEAMEQQMNNPLVQMRLRQMEELKAMKKRMKKEHVKEEKRREKAEKKRLKREEHRTKSEPRSDTDDRLESRRRSHDHHPRHAPRYERSRSRSRDRRRARSPPVHQHRRRHDRTYDRRSPLSRRRSYDSREHRERESMRTRMSERPTPESSKPQDDAELRRSLGLGEMSDRRKIHLEKEERNRLRHEAALKRQRDGVDSQSSKEGMSAEEMLEAGKARWSDFEKQVSREEELEREVAAAEEKAQGHNKYAAEMGKRMHFSDELTLEARLKNQRARRMKTSDLKDTLED